MRKNAPEEASSLVYAQTQTRCYAQVRAKADAEQRRDAQEEHGECQRPAGAVPVVERQRDQDAVAELEGDIAGPGSQRKALLLEQLADKESHGEVGEQSL